MHRNVLVTLPALTKRLPFIGTPLDYLVSGLEFMDVKTLGKIVFCHKNFDLLNRLVSGLFR